MNQEYNLQLVVLFSLIKATDENFTINFNDNQIAEIFEHKISINDLNKTLQDFGNSGIISYTRGGEDGFAEHFNISIYKEKYLTYIQDTYTALYSESQAIINGQLDKLKEIYGFLPENIVKEINESKEKLNDIETNISNSEFLQPLKPKIAEISKYLDKTEKVIKNYENIYLNIIKPLKKEGKQGIAATAIWAIISIIVTTILSFYFSYKSFNPHNNNEGIKQTEYINRDTIIDNTDLVRKVDFLTREVLGINENFQTNINSLLIKDYDRALVFISQKDSISIEPYYYYDFEKESVCLSTVDLRFFLNSRLISSQLLKEIFQIKSRHNNDKFYTKNSINVAEGDTIVFKNEVLKIDKIFSKNSKCITVGDIYNGVRIRKIKK